MANLLIPAAERNLNPDQVVHLDKLRAWGLTCQVIAGQFAIMGVVLWLWAGQDAAYSPRWMHPMAYYDVLCFAVAIILGIYGTGLRRGRPEFG